MNIDFLSAFFIGILGAGHCIAMCGGVSTMFTSAAIHQQKHSQLLLSILYNIGRITSYTFLGAIVGYTGSFAAKNIGLPLAGLRMISAIFIIFLGLYIGQWLMVIGRIEIIGKKLWQKLSPLSKKILPVDSPIKALSLGALWGWLPCGLVYSTLTWSLASGSLLNGAFIMLFFGLGTLPALLSISLGVVQIKSLLSNILFRKLMAIIMISYGLYSVYIAYRLLF